MRLLNRLGMTLLALLQGACVRVHTPTNPAGDSAADQEALAKGRHWVSAFYARKTDLLWERFGTKLRELMGNQSGLDKFRDQVHTQLGQETRLVEERVAREDGLHIYVRIARFEHSEGLVKVLIGLDGEGRIAAFAVVPAGPDTAAASRYLEYRTRARLRLPVEGAWRVAWGGRTLEQNAHAVARDQRFAYDLVIERNGVSHRGDGTANSDYYCYGATILSPGAGVVVSTANDVAENTPGSLNEREPLGNFVVLDHGDNEFSFLAHLVTGSVLVKPGERVGAGQPLGKCGNSGRSSEPHLHYHLQNTPRFGDGEGLPAQFETYTADGRPVARGEPSSGQIVHAALDGHPGS